ncbi:MAG: DUF4395 domain-containing protein [Nocardioidaceae bacterium]
MSALLAAGEVDPRGLRFAAALTTLVLATVLLTESAGLLAAQALVFAIAAFAGVHRSPYSLIYARWVRPRLGPPTETEDARAPQFAQLVGFVFALAGLAGFAAGVPVLGLVAAGLATGAAFLQAAFGLCLGCEVYLIVHRLTPSSPITHHSPARLPAQQPPTTEVSA